MTKHLTSGKCRIRPSGPLCGTIRVPGDKSISHRSVMMASLAEGSSQVLGFLKSEDCIATLHAFAQMGVKHEEVDDHLLIHGVEVHGLQEPETLLDMGNSGTGARLLLGVLSGQPFAATLFGDSSLRSRPMGRIANPLRQMGAHFLGRDNDNKLPLTVRGGDLHGIEYHMPVASAQIKSAILLAGLFANGTTVVVEPGPTRDHTERMLKTFGVDIRSEGYRHSLSGGQPLKATTIEVPGDISSAAFFAVMAAVVPGSDLIIEGVGINPTRTGILDVLSEMGADLTLQNERQCGAEPVADLHIRYRPLRGVHISGDTVVRMIDEFPIFAVAAAFADTPSVVSEAEELRVKESDRISSIVTELGKMGARIEEKPDGFTVQGGGQLLGADCQSYGDHRIAMSIAVSALASKGDTTIAGTAPIDTSFPNFFALLEQLTPDSLEILES